MCKKLYVVSLVEAAEADGLVMITIMVMMEVIKVMTVTKKLMIWMILTTSWSRLVTWPVPPGKELVSKPSHDIGYKTVNIRIEFEDCLDQET